MSVCLLSRSQHIISRNDIDPDALKVLYRLHRNHYLAYLVGGSVRDLMIGRQPKDFDIVTDARPNKVKRLFRNSLLIGRRFRLVHVRYGSKAIEVSTFRRNPERSGGSESRDLLVRHENTFGTPEQDAHRRDFTINGLFYNIADFSVIDYVGGLDDLNARIVRTIGDPEIRFQEDPVRMIRAVRVAGRIKFDIAPDSWNAIQTYRDQIIKCAPPRLFEEILHLLKHGAAADSMDLLYRSGLMEIMLPCLYQYKQELDTEAPLALRFLRELDRNALHHPLTTVPVLLAALFFPLIDKESESLKPGQDLRENVEKSLKGFARVYNVPRAVFDRMIQICIAQRWFRNHRSRRFRPMAFIRRDFFPEALMLASMRMRCDPEAWQGDRERWLDRIQHSDLKQDLRRILASLLSIEGHLP